VYIDFQHFISISRVAAIHSNYLAGGFWQVNGRSLGTMENNNIDLFKRDKKRETSSHLDARWGDLSISAPNQGSWNQAPRSTFKHKGPAKVKQSRARRFVAMLWPKSVFVHGRRTSQHLSPSPVSNGSLAEVPHHPLAARRGVGNRYSTEKGCQKGFQANEGEGIVMNEETPSSYSHPFGVEENEFRVSLRAVSPFDGRLRAETQEAIDEETVALPPLDFKSPRSSGVTRSVSVYSTSRIGPKPDQNGSLDRLSGSNGSTPTSPELSSLSATETPSSSRSPNSWHHVPSWQPRPHPKRQQQAISGPQQLVPSYEELWG